MKTLYKLTDQNNKTHSDTLWGPGVKHIATGKDYFLCTKDLIHAYEDPLLAMFISPIHVKYMGLKLWKAKTTCKKIVREDQLKCGVKSLTTIKEIPLPVITTTQRIAFGILCAKKVCSDIKWNKWADKWLSGEDRSIESARAAYYVGAANAAYAANDARDAACAAARAAACAAEYAAEYATKYAAEYAAWYASCAAARAAAYQTTIDLKEIAKEAMKY
jgi:hypothetical protein